MTDTRVDSDTGEVALPQKLVQLVGTESALDKDNDLVELQIVEKVTEFAVLLLFAQLDVILLKTMKCELSVVVDVHLERVTHELLADRPDFLRESGTEHHNLLLCWGGAEDFLNITAHVYTILAIDLSSITKKLTNLVKHLITFIENESLDVAKRQLLITDKCVQATRGTDNNVGSGLLVAEELNILLHGSTSVENGSLHLRKVFAESGIFVLDLISQLTGVAHNQDLDFSLNGV